MNEEKLLMMSLALIGLLRDELKRVTEERDQLRAENATLKSTVSIEQAMEKI